MVLPKMVPVTGVHYVTKRCVLIVSTPMVWLATTFQFPLTLDGQPLAAAVPAQDVTPQQTTTAAAVEMALARRAETLNV